MYCSIQIYLKVFKNMYSVMHGNIYVGYNINFSLSLRGYDLSPCRVYNEFSPPVNAFELHKMIRYAKYNYTFIYAL